MRIVAVLSFIERKNYRRLEREQEKSQKFYFLRLTAFAGLYILARDEQRERMRISVTQRDIAMGRNKIATEGDAPCNCPVALAISKALKCVVSVVGLQTYYVRWHGLPFGREIKLPPRARSWIWRFDTGRPAQPFSFNLKVK